jgi:hypothetical protein
MERTEYSEMLAYKIQMLGNYPQESIQHSEQGESLKSRIILKSCFPTNSLQNTIHKARIKTPTCFGTEMPSSGSYYNKGVLANLLIYVLFIVIGLSKTLFFFFVLAVVLRPNAGHGLLILDVSRSNTTTHHSREDSFGRVISSSPRPLPDTRHSQQTNIHPPCGIRTQDLSR